MTSKPELDVVLDPKIDRDAEETLLDIWVEVTNADGAVGFVPPVTREDIDEVATATLRRAVEGPDHLVVAYIDGAPVGFCFLEQRPGPLFTHWAFIKRLMIRPHLQGSGLGGTFLDQIHDIGRELGLEQFHLTVRGGTGIERFYEKYGYEVRARIAGVIRLAPDDTRDELYLVREL